MAPEQLRGEDTDARTDVFAFGVLLHQMLTGRRPFRADSSAGLIAAILEHDPPPVRAPEAGVPASLDVIVRRCLAKNPDQRWQAARHPNADQSRIPHAALLAALKPRVGEGGVKRGVTTVRDR